MACKLLHTHNNDKGWFTMSYKEELTQWKLTELKKFASELNIKGRSKMNALELADAIAQHIEKA